MKENTIKYQNSTIFYGTAGQGKRVVLIHGFAEDSNVWASQVHFLQDHFQVIVPDIPGSGRSELVPNADIDNYAEIIKLILDRETAVQKSGAPEAKDRNTRAAAHPQPVTIIGHSMGGYITLAFAEKYPQYLDSFGLFHSTAFEDDEEKKATRTKAIDFINDKGSGAFLKTATPGLFTKKFADENPEKVNGLIENGRHFSAAALIQYYRAMIARPDRTKVLTTFPKPILFIIGEHDNAIPLQSSLRQCYLPAKSHVHILAHSAHMGMWEEEEKANTVLYKFLINKF